MPVAVSRSADSSVVRDGNRTRDPEVGDHRVTVFEEDILRLDVAVDDTLPVGVLERVGDLAREPHRIIEGNVLRGRAAREATRLRRRA